MYSIAAQRAPRTGSRRSWSQETLPGRLGREITREIERPVQAQIVEVERLDHLLSGARRCSYRVRRTATD